MESGRGDAATTDVHVARARGATTQDDGERALSHGVTPGTPPGCASRATRVAVCSPRPSVVRGSQLAPIHVAGTRDAALSPVGHTGHFPGSVGSRMTGSARAAWQRRWWWWCVLPQAAHVQQRSHNTGWVLEATRGGPGSVVRSGRLVPAARGICGVETGRAAILAHLRRVCGCGRGFAPHAHLRRGCGCGRGLALTQCTRVSAASGVALGRTSRKVFWPHKSQRFFVGTFNAHTAHKSQSFCLAHVGSHTRARATPRPHRHTAPVMRACHTTKLTTSAPITNFGSHTKRTHACAGALLLVRVAHARATPWPRRHTAPVMRKLCARVSHHRTYNFGSDHKLRLTHKANTRVRRGPPCAGRTRARATPWPHRHTAPVMRARHTTKLTTSAPITNFGSHTKRTHACAGALLVPARAKFATCLRLRSHTSARTDAV